MSIVENRKAFHDYFIEERFEAGLALEGWEVKAVRAGRAHLTEAYVIVKSSELVLLGAHIESGTASFELGAPDADEMHRRMTGLIADGYPWLVAVLDGAIVGYAYAGPYRPRPAYRYTVEDSVYLATGAQRKGIGRALL